MQRTVLICVGTLLLASATFSCGPGSRQNGGFRPQGATMYVFATGPNLPNGAGTGTGGNGGTGGTGGTNGAVANLEEGTGELFFSRRRRDTVDSSEGSKEIPNEQVGAKHGKELTAAAGIVAEKKFQIGKEGNEYGVKLGVGGKSELKKDGKMIGGGLGIGGSATVIKSKAQNEAGGLNGKIKGNKEIYEKHEGVKGEMGDKLAENHGSSENFLEEKNGKESKKVEAEAGIGLKGQLEAQKAVKIEKNYKESESKEGGGLLHKIKNAVGSVLHLDKDNSQELGKEKSTNELHGKEEAKLDEKLSANGKAGKEGKEGGEEAGLKGHIGGSKSVTITKGGKESHFQEDFNVGAGVGVKQQNQKSDEDGSDKKELKINTHLGGGAGISKTEGH